MTLVLGIDLGTGGVRVGIYDGESGTAISGAERRYETVYPRPGWAEQDPDTWWTATVAACRDAIDAAGRDDIAGVTVATTASTVVACREDGTPVCRALLWMDCRADQEARESAALSHPVMRYCGGSDAAEWLVPKAMWLARHQPEIFADAQVICEAIDYLNFRLTGEWVGSRMNAACKWNYDSARGAFVPDVYDALGVPALKDKLPARIVPVGDAIAPMRPDLAAELGLRIRPLVAQGGIDAHIGMLGAGTIKPGSMLLIGGTSVVHLTHLLRYQDLPGFWGPYPNALMDDHWLVEGGQVSAGAVLDWLVRTIFGLDEAGHQALIEEAAALAPEAPGLSMLDYFMGNRTPYRDTLLRGAIVGLSLGHGRADIYRAAVDAIVLGTVNVLKALEAVSVPIEKIVMAGGICQNPLWLQATVDALGRPVELVRDENLSTLGAGICAANALDVHTSLEAASHAMGAKGVRVEPDPERTAWYENALGEYRDLTQTLQPALHRLSSAQAHAA